MSENLQKEEDFISSSEMLLNVTSSIVDSILLDIFWLIDFVLVTSLYFTLSIEIKSRERRPEVDRFDGQYEKFWDGHLRW